MHRSLRALVTTAAILAATGLLILPASAAPGAKAPVATDFSSAAKTKKVIVGPRRAIVGPRRTFVAPKRTFVAPRRVIVGPKRVIVGPRVVGPRVVGPRIRGPLILRGRTITVIRGPRSVFWRGRNRTLIPLAAIGAITVGAIAYRAYGYVPVEQPMCSGPTPDGCELRWQDVPTPEGDLVPQCVQFCPPEP